MKSKICSMLLSLLVVSVTLAIQHSPAPLTLPADTPALERLTGSTGAIQTSVPFRVKDAEQPAWLVFRKELTGSFSIATGHSISLGKSLEDDRELIGAVTDFALENSRLLDLGNTLPDNAVLSQAGNKRVIRFDLLSGKTVIEGGSIIFVISQAGDLISIKVDSYGDRTEGSFAITPSQAEIIAARAIPANAKITSIRPTYLPRHGDDGALILRASYRVELKTDHPALQPTLFIDASSGEILATENRVNFVEVEGTMIGTYFPLYGRDDPEQAELPYEWLQVDEDSLFSGPWGTFRVNLEQEDAPWRFQSELRGLWTNVVELAVLEQEAERSRMDGEFEGDLEVGFDWINNWDDENSSPDERNLYVHVNIIHDHYKQLDPDFDGLDYPLLSVCGVGGAGWEGFEDNAFSSAQGLFFGRGRNWDNFAHYADVIYHEYGHSVTAQIYGNNPLPYEGESGALNEGWSDYFTCSLTDESGVGEGGLLGNGMIRNINNNLVYPRDLRGEVHDDSRIVSAAMWHTREILGAEYADSLFHFARYLFGNDFREYFLDVLITDDDDGNIDNGTPNYRYLYEQFSRHGIDLGEASQLRIASKDISDASNNGGDGNNNGIFEQSETLTLDVSVFRAASRPGQQEADIVVTLTSDSPWIEIIRGEATMDHLDPGEIGSIPERLLFRVDDDAPLAFANIFVTAGVGGDETPDIDTLRIVLGHPQIAIFNAGAGSIDRSPWIERALERIDLVYNEYRLDRLDRPLRSTLARHQMAILFTGDEREPLQDEGELTAISEYLDGGGRMILSCQNTATLSADFLETYFGVSFLGDTTGLGYLEGNADDPVSQNQRLLLAGGNGANNQGRPDIIEAVNDGIVTHRWTRIGNELGGAVRRVDPNTLSRTLYFAFGIEAVGGAGGGASRTTTLDTLMARSLMWLSGEEGVEEETHPVSEFALEGAYPNPFNDVTRISFALPREAKTRLTVYDLAGRWIAEILNGEVSAGRHQAIWNAAGVTSGLYIVRFEADGFTASKKLTLIK